MKLTGTTREGILAANGMVPHGKEFRLGLRSTTYWWHEGRRESGGERGEAHPLEWGNGSNGKTCFYADVPTVAESVCCPQPPASHKCFPLWLSVSRPVLIATDACVLHLLFPNPSFMEFPRDIMADASLPIQQNPFSSPPIWFHPT